MKTILLALSFFIFVDCFSQAKVDDLSLDDYLNLDELANQNLINLVCSHPRSVNFEIVAFCINENQKIYTVFKQDEDELIAIWKEYIFSSKSEAEINFQKLVKETELKIGLEPKLSLREEKGISYNVTPIGERDFYKVPIINKDLASRFLTLVKTEEFSSDLAYDFRFITNSAIFNTAGLEFRYIISLNIWDNKLSVHELIIDSIYKDSITY